MLDRKLLSLALFGFLAACGGDDGSSDGNGDEDGGGTDDDGGQIDADAAVASCAPVSGTDLALEPVASDLLDPIFVTSPPGDTRLFVVERAGVIKIIEDGNVLDEPFLDISGRVFAAGPMSSGEQGLLGLAFHPEYGSTGRFFVFYIAQESDVGEEANVVSQFMVSSNPDRADMDSEERILEVADDFSNHNGGMLAFGPTDGYLYIGMGDGGDGGDPHNNGQDRTTVLGDMLRIDVDGGNPYAIPATNPLVGDGGGVREEIWLSGLRNPWRWSFDKANGDMYIGDVGQGTIEEVTVVPAGQSGLDLGWDEVEGNQCFNDQITAEDPGADPDCTPGNHKAPVATYQHNGEQRSINGGYVYRGTCFPDIVGWYFYGDWITDQVWKFEGPTGANNQEVTDDLDPDGVIDGMSSFGQDIFGEVYVVSMLGGTIHRIVVE